jgi:uncharacterized protein
MEIRELSDPEIGEILARMGFGHLACTRDDKPYVVPIHYVYADESIFIYTTEGKKSGIIRANPNVCLQVEEITDDQHWQSVVAEGRAEQITDADELDAARKLLVAANPTLTPALSIRWMDDWVRENIEVIYRMIPIYKSGRSTANRELVDSDRLPG